MFLVLVIFLKYESRHFSLSAKTIMGNITHTVHDNSVTWLAFHFLALEYYNVCNWKRKKKRNIRDLMEGIDKWIYYFRSASFRFLAKNGNTERFFQKILPLYVNMSFWQFSCPLVNLSVESLSVSFPFFNNHSFFGLYSGSISKCISHLISQETVFSASRTVLVVDQVKGFCWQ